MTSRHTHFWTARGYLTGSLLALCGLRGLAHGEPAADTSLPPADLGTAQDLSKLITTHQWFSIAAGVAVLGLLLFLAYLVPLIRAPRWQILGFAVVPVIAAFVTMTALSRPIEPKITAIPDEGFSDVANSDSVSPQDKDLMKKVGKWRGEISGESFLIDVSSMPMTATFGATAALVALLWAMSHRRVLRAS